jgi:hypothetical protein
MIKQKISILLTLLMSGNKSGILQYIANNFKRVIFPVVTVFFLLQIFPLNTNLRTNYFVYLYIGLFYLVFVLSTSRKVIQWFSLECQRGTIESIQMTQIGIEGVVRYLFLIYLSIFFILEAPIYIAIMKYFFNFNLCRYFGFSLLFYTGLNILLIYSLILIGVSVILLFNTNAFNAETHRSIFNLIAGAYCPISVFPATLQVFSLALPFTHGLILFRKIIADKMGVSVMDFIPFTLFTAALLVLGHYALKRTIVLMQREQCFLNY